MTDFKPPAPPAGRPAHKPDCRCPVCAQKRAPKRKASSAPTAEATVNVTSSELGAAGVFAIAAVALAIGIGAAFHFHRTLSPRSQT